MDSRRGSSSSLSGPPSQLHAVGWSGPHREARSRRCRRNAAGGGGRLRYPDKPSEDTNLDCLPL
jgi:hypothetical protein